MPLITAPPIETSLSDIELFARAYFNIQLTRNQLDIIRKIANDQPVRISRRMGLSTAQKIARAYLHEGLNPMGRTRLPMYSLPKRDKLKGYTQEGKILAAIKHGGAFNFELSRIALKYTSVISELRKDGHHIIAERQMTRNGKFSNTFKYYLIGE